VEVKKSLYMTLRGPSAAVFGNDKQMPQIPVDVGGLRLFVTHTTRSVMLENGSYAPGHLLIEVAGEVPATAGLMTYMRPFANAGVGLLSVISLAANASVSTPEIELLLDATSPVGSREYFHSYVQPEQRTPYVGRVVSIDPTVALITALFTHKHAARLQRAFSSYMLALQNWQTVKADVALAHLWMAVEVLTPVQIDAALTEKNLSSREALAAQLKIDGRACALGRALEAIMSTTQNIAAADLPTDECTSLARSRANDLDAYIRQKYLLHGDAECYKDSKAASDGIEHGHMEAEKVMNLSFSMRDRLAAHVRKSILNLAGLSDAHTQTLLSPPYNVPLACQLCTQYRFVWCHIVGEGEITNGRNYPPMRWHSEVTEAVVRNQEMQYGFSDMQSPDLPSGLSFSPACSEVRLKKRSSS
jgi:hypothetical protein